MDRAATVGLAWRRLVAFCIDWLLIAAWGGLLFLAVYRFHGGIPERASGPWIAQGVGLVSMTLPVLLYFSVFESGRWGGSVGKRVLRLRVTDADGRPLRLRTALLRNGIKFLPWEIGHLVAQQAYYAQGAVPAWIYLPMALSMLIPLWWLSSLLRGVRTPYDALAGATVVGAPPSPNT